MLAVGGYPLCVLAVGGYPCGGMLNMPVTELFLDSGLSVSFLESYLAAPQLMKQPQIEVSNHVTVTTYIRLSKFAAKPRRDPPDY